MGSVITSVLVVAVGLILARISHVRFDELGRRVDRMEERLDKRMDSFQASVDGMRSDLTAVALAVGARPRTGQAGSHH